MHFQFYEPDLDLGVSCGINNFSFANLPNCGYCGSNENLLNLQLNLNINSIYEYTFKSKQSKICYQL